MKREQKNIMTRRKRMNMTAKVNNLIGIKRRCKSIKQNNLKLQRVPLIAILLYQS